MKKVKVGGLEYEIKLKDRILSDDNQDCYGMCIAKDCVIELLNNVPKQRQDQTLVHEIMHAVFEEAGITDDNEEDIVNRLSLVWYQVLKDNDFSFIR